VTEPVAPLRILHAPVNIANQAGYVAAALRRMGHEVEVWQYGPNPFGFPADRSIDLETRDPRVLWSLFDEALDRFDVFHFHFARSLLTQEWGGLPPLWDLPVYRVLGKRVFFTFHGSDVRIRRIHEQVNPWSLYRQGVVQADDERTEKVLDVIRTYADRMFVVGPSLRDFVPEAEVLPRVMDLAEWPERPVEQRERPLVVHLPSSRETKGTPIVLEALERLAADGVGFDLRLVEGVPHSVARETVAGADIVIDNVIAGAYGLVSMEAMACGRVAVANVGDATMVAFPGCPVVDVDPSTVTERLRALIADRELRLRIAAAGRPFLARVHDAPVIAARLVEHYTSPQLPVPRRPMPGWFTRAPRGQIETLDLRVARLEQDLARARHREEVLRRRFGLAPLGLEPIPPEPTLKGQLLAFVPGPLLRRLRRLRASTERRLR